MLQAAKSEDCVNIKLSLLSQVYLFLVAINLIVLLVIDLQIILGIDQDI